MGRRTCMSSWCGKLLAAAAALMPSIALACTSDESPLFTCETERSDYYVSICALETQPGQSWSTAQYRYGKEEEPPECVYPPDPADGPKKLFFSHQGTAHSYTV